MACNGVKREAKEAIVSKTDETVINFELKETASLKLRPNAMRRDSHKASFPKITSQTVFETNPFSS